MPVYQLPLPPAVTSGQPFARLGKAIPQPLISIWLVGPNRTQEVLSVLDTGAECCLFPEWIAWRIGHRKSSANPQLMMGNSMTLTGVPARLDNVELELRDPVGLHRPFRWKTIVGFTSRGSFSKTSASGILGVNGGLDQFQGVEFDWQALAGPEVVIRT